MARRVFTDTSAPDFLNENPKSYFPNSYRPAEPKPESGNKSTHNTMQESEKVQRDERDILLERAAEVTSDLDDLLSEIDI